jgi:hypothetical protein
MVFEPLLRAPTSWISVLDHFAVHLFEGAVSVADIDRMQYIGERWNAQHPGKRAELVVIFPSDTRLTHEERSRFAQLVKAGQAYRAASATVILASGMLGSMQRSMLTGLTMIAPPPHPSKVFGSIADAMVWLGPHVQATCPSVESVEALVRALTLHVEAFRARGT